MSEKENRQNKFLNRKKLRVAAMRSSCKLNHVSEWMVKLTVEHERSECSSVSASHVCFRFSFIESKRNFEEVTSSTVSWMSLSNFTIFLFIFWDAHVFLKLRNSGRKGWKKNKKTGVSVLTIFWLDYKADSSLWFLIDDRIIRIRRIIIFKYFKKHFNYARLRACVEIASFIDKTPEIWRFFCVSKLSLPHARQWLWMLAEIKWKRWKKKSYTNSMSLCIVPMTSSKKRMHPCYCP